MPTTDTPTVDAALRAALAAGKPLELTVTSRDGRPISSGSAIVDAKLYDLEPVATRLDRTTDDVPRLALQLVADARPRGEFEVALARLFEVAMSDTGQSRIVANFLLAWWNAADHGGFDVADIFSLDRELAAAITTVIAHLGQCSGAVYADAYGYQPFMERLIADWRPRASAAK